MWCADFKGHLRRDSGTQKTSTYLWLKSWRHCPVQLQQAVVSEVGVWVEVTVAHPMLHVDKILGTFSMLPPVSHSLGAAWFHGQDWVTSWLCHSQDRLHLGGTRRASTSGVVTSFPHGTFLEAVPFCLLALFVCSPHQGLLPLERILLWGALRGGRKGQLHGYLTLPKHPDVALLEWLAQVFPEERGGGHPKRVSSECIPLTRTTWFMKKCSVQGGNIITTKKAFLHLWMVLLCFQGDWGVGEVNLIQHH